MAIFENIEVAFKDKTNKDLNRAYILFKSISNPFFSKIATKLIKGAIFFKIPIDGIVKKTIYKHFCGGTTIKDSTSTINKLWDSKIGTILDFSSEGKATKKDFHHAMNETIATIQEAKNNEKIPFSVFKPTGLARFNLLEKINNNIKLSNKEIIEKNEFTNRIEKICTNARRNKVPVFIDAEESWIQNGVDDIAQKMMRKFNTKNTWVFNTIQMYRKDRIAYLSKLIKDAKKYKYKIGIKIVRGAYHEQEIERSIIKKYTSPVYKEKYLTDINYNKGLEICLKNIDLISVCAGTHNEESSELLIKLLKKHNIKNNDKRISFSQLLGMSDHISYNIAKKGFNVAKYVPYGPVKDVIPYLIRRAEENTSISGQMNRELTNIIKEIKRRKKNT